MSDLNIIPGIFNTYKSFSDCSTDEVAEGVCPWIEIPYKREDICNYLIGRAFTARFPKLCPFTSGPGAELFELVLLLVLLILVDVLLLICCFRGRSSTPSLEEDDSGWEREQNADDCEYESKKRKRE
tara:strand:- start:324 stop:704 length:381 start_codon:yes stop_codon:yes gene_type:complete